MGLRYNEQDAQVHPASAGLSIWVVMEWLVILPIILYVVGLGRSNPSPSGSTGRKLDPRTHQFPTGPGVSAVDVIAGLWETPVSASFGGTASAEPMTPSNRWRQYSSNDKTRLFENVEWFERADDNVVYVKTMDALSFLIKKVKDAEKKKLFWSQFGQELTAILQPDEGQLVGLSFPGSSYLDGVVRQADSSLYCEVQDWSTFVQRAFSLTGPQFRH